MDSSISLILVLGVQCQFNEATGYDLYNYSAFLYNLNKININLDQMDEERALLQDFFFFCFNEQTFKLIKQRESEQ